VSDRPSRPLLFLDVDGTLIPMAGAQLPSTVDEWNATWQNPSNPHLATVTAAHGPRLMQMPCDIVWATAWMHDANRVIAPILGLPDLPVADLGALPGLDDPAWSEADEAAALSWKTRALVALASGRPFAWVDDELTTVDRAWVSAHHAGPALLHRVDSSRGLTAADVTVLEDWFQSL
jgi:hypothetical protein